MEIDNLQNKLMCIQYPGLVKDIDNMLRTLGGINQIAQTFNSDNRRLQLKFRPDNLYAKPAFGDCSTTTGILLKVTVRTPKNKQCPKHKQTQTVSIIGLIEKTYKFESTCDFQYLPIGDHVAGRRPQCIYDTLVPKGILSPDWLTENVNVPYFLPPTSFSRFDSSAPNLFRKIQSKQDDNDDGLIGKTRLRRIKQATYIQFSLTDPIPEKPATTSTTEDYLKLKFVTTEQFNAVKELFDKRPIMSKMVVSYETQIPNDKLKYIMPILCFYYTTGPWRIMWVRYGYDPRKDFESRYYQQLDYRVRTHIGIKDHIEVKRYHTVAKTLKKNLKIIPTMQEKLKRSEIVYYPYFESGRLPQSRQCIYQYCDIRIPKIQEMLDKIPTPLSGATCNEKSGWLPANFDDQCREIISAIVKELIDKNKDDSEYIEEDETYSDEEDENLDDAVEDSDNEMDVN